MNRRRIHLLFLALATGCARPSNPPESRSAIEVVCRWSDETIVPGAAPGEARWRPASGVERSCWRARLLWDREFLYFTAELEERYFSFSLRPDRIGSGSIEFRLDAAKGGCGLLHPGGDANPSTVGISMDHSVKRCGEGWVAEGRVPWYAFLAIGGRPEPGDRWTLALCGEESRTVRFEGSPSREEWRKRFPPLVTSRVQGSPEPPKPYQVERVYPKLEVSYPIAIARQPATDLLLFVDEVSPYGRTSLRRFRDAAETAQAETLLDLDGVAYGMAFHPAFAENGWLFLGWNGPVSGGKRKTRVSRFTMSRESPYALDLRSEKVIIEWEADGHNGGDVAFGKDGFLYVTSGDGTSDSDANVVGQDLSKLTSKVLRIDIDNPAPGRTYSVPKDNPFVGRDEARPETWAYGLRNPWRLTVDSVTGQIWVGNNGQDLWESAYLVEKGANYGWSIVEGSHPFYLNRKQGPTPILPPTVEHSHSESRSLTGGLVYRGKRFPDLDGAYLYGDYSTGKIWAAKHDGTRLLWRREIADTTLQITGFGLDPRGEVLISDHRGGGKGGFYTLEPTPPEEPRPEFPRTLSASGLFRSVRQHLMEPGLIPYSVNAPLWSDGALKSRWIAIPSSPGEEAAIEFTTWRGWNFPDGAVLVKSFALETEAGDPASARWVETRFLTKQAGQWAGYSYAWNDDQTEGTLVEAPGRDRTWVIRDPSAPEGTRRQTWHFPSRAECMVCHSRAANFVLGLSELQMNREHDYGGVRAEQLGVLESLGLLRVDWAREAGEGLRREAKSLGKSGKEAEKYFRERSPGRGEPLRPSHLLARPASGYRRLADPADPRGEVDQRARSYLHANCSHCHVEAGGGNSQMELEATTATGRMRVIDVAPFHPIGGAADARIVAPGAPERSTLLARIARRGAGQMPPLATSQIDPEAVALLREWIERMPPAGKR